MHWVRATGSGLDLLLLICRLVINNVIGASNARFNGLFCSADGGYDLAVFASFGELNRVETDDAGSALY